MTKLVNNTPHSLNFISGEDAIILTIPPSKEVARVEFEDLGQTQVLVERVPVTVNLGKRATGVSGVPAPTEDTLIVVSRVVKSVLPDRDDLVVPDDLVRNAAGRVVGCRRLSR